MAIAGKVAITPGGNWSELVAYDKLVVVTYNNDLYLSKKANTGVTPTDTENWQLLIKNVTQEQYDNIINGTTTVGNANKLGGKGASEYALETEILNNSLWNELTIGFDLNNALGKYRTMQSTIVNSLLNKPDTVNSGEVTIEWFSVDSNNLYGMQILRYSYYSSSEGSKQNIYFRVKASTVFGEWKELATTADLANYLPKSGGDIGNGTATTPLYFNTDSTDAISIGFNMGNVTKGWIGYDNNNQLIMNDTKGRKTVLHTGNKPSGSYTGNGDATERKINIGGIGGIVYLYNRDRGTGILAYSNGFLVFNSTSSVIHLSSSHGEFWEGTLKITSSNELINGNGCAIVYWLL